MKKTDKLFSDLVKLMASLRSKNGCPWDKVQTHKSLKPCLVEETYEVLDAIDKKNPRKLLDELGDLLYQILFHAQIASERKRFTINDVLKHSYQKLYRRHPHVFGNKKIRGPKNVILHWHRQKWQEEEKKIYKSAVANIPKTLPALQKAGKVQRKAAQVGFEWHHENKVLAKVDEELAEVRSAIKKKKPSQINEEIGDLLFAIANLARFMDIEPENALHQTINKFIIRFRKMERLLARQRKDIEKCTLQEMEQAWNTGKTS